MTILIPLILAVVLVVFCGWLIFLSVRSILKLPVNLPPSERTWKKVTAQILDEATIPVQYYHRGRYSDGTVQKLVVSYQYDGNTYTASVRGTASHQRRITVYCKRKHPELCRVFVPQAPLSAEAVVSMLLLSGFACVLVCIIVTMVLIPNFSELIHRG